MDIACKILIPNVIKSRARGKEFLGLLLKHFPLQIPERYGREEPLRKKFAANDLNAVLNEWGHLGFTAERRTPRLFFDVWFAIENVPQPEHTSVHLDLQLSHAELPQVIEFLTESSTLFGADLALAHILTRNEFDERLEMLRQEPNSRPDYILERLSTLGLLETLGGMTVMQFKPAVIRRGIPELCWLTVFGSPYVELFGKDRILSAPATEISELNNGALMVRLTDGLGDDAQSWCTFKDVQRRCKEHLNSNAFFDAINDSDRLRVVRNAPSFRFPIELYKARTTC